MFKWTTDGIVEVLDDSDVSKLRPKYMDDLANRMGKDNKENEIPELAAAEAKAIQECAKTETCTLPETQHLKIRVGYDDGILGHLKSASEVEKYIQKIWPHVQAYFCHASLGSKVQVERAAGIKHYKGKSLKCDPEAAAQASLKGMEATTMADLGDANLMLYFGFIGAGYPQGGGIGNRAAVCAPKQYSYGVHSINCYGSSIPQMGELLAHEIGHNLGMYHDMAKDRPDGATDCDKKGFMSYEGNPNKQWSRCSKKDFTGLYNSYLKHYIQHGEWCLKAAPKACVGVSAPPPSGPPSAPPPGPGPNPGSCPQDAPGAPGDGYCDDHYNTPACKFDGGDCCPGSNPKPDWKDYCIECKCKAT